MMDFDNWWKDYIGSDTDKSLELGSTYAKCAWNQQQKRIAELERDLSAYKAAEELWCRRDDQHQRLREAAQKMVDSCDIEFTEFFKGDGTYSHSHKYIVFKPNALEDLKAALLEGEE